MISNRMITIEFPVEKLLEQMKPMLEEEAIDRIAAAKILGISVPTLDRLLSKNELPYRKVGGRVIFLKNELYAWLRGQRSDSPKVQVR